MNSCYHLVLSPVKIAILDNCDYYSLGRIITRVNVPKEFRGNSHGTTLLKQVLEDADKEGINLFLEISESDGLSYEQLKDWYERHGFKPWRGIWRRRPKTSIRSGVSEQDSPPNDNPPIQV